VITNDAVFDAISDVTDEMQRMRQMLVALCVKNGIDPDQVQRLPGEGKHPEQM
jgi:hypothetical protein